MGKRGRILPKKTRDDIGDLEQRKERRNKCNNQRITNNRELCNGQSKEILRGRIKGYFEQIRLGRWTASAGYDANGKINKVESKKLRQTTMIWEKR